MDTLIWVIQGLLAVTFFMVGIVKVVLPKEKLYESRMEFVEDFSQTTVRAIGTLEVLGAIGLILPMMLDILPVLTPLAAAGLILTMLGAALTHYRRHEMSEIAPNMVLLALALFVVIGRLALEPVA